MPHDLPRTTVTGGGLWREKVAQTDPSGENAPRLAATTFRRYSLGRQGSNARDDSHTEKSRRV
jgi:hypothetical protein